MTASRTVARVPTWAVGVGLVLLHLAVTFQVRPYPRWNDGIFVLNDASTWPDLTRPLDHHALRIGTIFPAKLFVELFGYGQWSYYAWPFLTGILLVAATFALGTVLFGRWTAAAATVLLAFHPVLVDTAIRFGRERMTSWQLLPDIPSAAFFTLGLALLVAGAERERRGAAASPWWFIGAGLCFGWAYLVRELTVFVFPVIAQVLLVWRSTFRRWAQVGAAMLACLALELVTNAVVHGNPLVRLEIGSEHGSAPPEPLTRLDALLRFPRIVAVYPQTLVVLATVVLTVLGALLLRRRGNWLMLTWFVSLWLPLTLVSGLLSPDFIRINASLMRYWIPALPALCLGAAAAVAGGLAVLGRSSLADRPTAVRGLTVGVTVLALAAWCVPLLDDIARNPQDRSWNAMRSALAARDGQIDSIVTDDRDALILGIYSREPVGGDRIVRATVRRTGHGLDAVPLSDGDPGTWLVWTPTMSRQRPTEADGWRLVLRERQLHLYAPTSAPATRK